MTIQCDLSTDLLMRPSDTPVPIQQCANISVGTGGFGVDIFTQGTVNISGPGTLYIGATMALLIADSASALSAIIERQRSSFVPVVPPVNAVVRRRLDELVLNLDDEQNEPPIMSNDVLMLMGAMCQSLLVGQSLTYSGSMLVQRRGLETLNEFAVDDLHTVLLQNLAGFQCDVLTRHEQQRDGFLSGPGFFCVGDSGLNSVDRTAFFTNTTDIPEMISNTVVNELLRCAMDSGTLEGSFPPNVGTSVVRLSGEQVELFGGSDMLQKDSNGVGVFDRFNNTRAVFTCPDTGVMLAVWRMNNLEFTSASGTINFPGISFDGGMTVIFNPDDCMVFAYPTGLQRITEVINDCRESAMVTPPPAVVFTTMTDSFGRTALLVNGMQVLTTTGSMSFSVGGGQLVMFSGNANTVNIVQPGTNQILESFGEISSFTANTAINRAVTTTSGMSIFNGPGTLYVDNDGMALFTTVSVVMDIVRSFSSAPFANVGIGLQINGSTNMLSIQVDGNDILNITSPGAITRVRDGESVTLTDGVLRVSRVVNIPADDDLTYYPGDQVLRVGEVNFTMIVGFFVGDIDGVNMGNPITISNDETFSGGGILYSEMNSAVYWPSSQPPRDMLTLGFLENIDGISVIMPIENIRTGFVFDGSQLQVFDMNALMLLPGPGLLVVDGGNFFFGNSPEQIQGIPDSITQLLRPEVMFDENSGLVIIDATNAGGSILGFPIGSRTRQFPPGRLIYDGRNITTSDGRIIAVNVSSLTVFDGFTTTVVNSPNEDDFLGGGFLAVDEETGMAFYTSSSIVASDLSSTVDAVTLTFRSPVIPDTEPDTVISKLNEIDAGFGQALTVYEGADVNLRCAVEAIPPAMITFSTRPNASQPFEPITVGSDFNVMVNGPNDVTLHINGTDQGEAEFRCEAMNLAGADARITTIKVRPPGQQNVPTAHYVILLG
jgi:hypothetical protein